jgi:hypothetical protein
MRLDDLLGAFRERSADLDRGLLERVMAGQPVEAHTHKFPGAIEIAALASQLRLEECQLRPTESAVSGYPVEPVIGVIVGQPVQ